MIKKIEDALRAIVPQGDQHEPMVLQHAICAELSAEIVAIGGGQSRFPFTDICVQLYASNDKEQAIYESSFVEGQRLERVIRDHLLREGCRVPERLRVEIRIVRDPAPQWASRGFDLNCGRAGEESPPRLRLTVMRGSAQQPVYEFSKPLLHIGRLEEASDKHGVLRLRNDLIFTDVDDEINRTVSRRHARIEFDEQSREYRIHDLQSKRGTRIERDGRFVEVAGPRGVALRDGDAVHLGHARLCVNYVIDAYTTQQL